MIDYQKILQSLIRSGSETQPPGQPTEATVPAAKKSKGEPWKIILKYFLHGISFSILLMILSLLWAVIFAVLVVVGFIIGLIIGFLVLLMLVGGLNSFLTDIIWSIHVKTRWTILLVHGLVLLAVLVIAGIPQLIVNLVAPSLPTQIALFIIYAFIDGFVARKIGKQFEEE